MAIEDYRSEIFRNLNYQPTPLQDEIHKDTHRIKLVAGGERGGKSHVGSKEADLYIPRSKLIWLVGAEYEKTRPEFEYIFQDCLKLELVKSGGPTKIPPWEFICWNGCRVATKSAKDPQDIGMEAPDFVLVCEAAQLEYEAFLRLRGRIAEKRAPMMLTGTFEGSLGWYAEYFTRWQGANIEDAKSHSLPSWENHIIYPSGNKEITLHDGRVIKNVNDEIYKLWESMPPDIFLERCGGVPCPPSGLIMKEFSNLIHVGDYSFDPELPVELAVDPGYAGAHAVEVIQVKSDIPYLIDEIYLQGYTTEEVIEVAKQRKWWQKVTGGAIDVAGKQHQAMAAPVEIWQKRGIHLQSKKVEEEGGIELLRTFLKVNPVTNKPKLFVNHACKGFIAECGGGKSPVFGGGSWLRDVNTSKPIDKNNHACKAVIYWLVNRFGYGIRQGESNWGKVFTRDSRGEAMPVRR